MNQQRQSKSIVFFCSPVHTSLPVAGTEPAQGPNSGPVGRDGFPVAGSRAPSLRLSRADVALGSSVPSDTIWNLKRIEGRPDSVSRGRTMRDAGRQLNCEGNDESDWHSMQHGKASLQAPQQGLVTGMRKRGLLDWPEAPKNTAPSGSGSRKGSGDRPLRQFPLALPPPSAVHRLWPHQIHGPRQPVEDGDRIGPSNLGGLRLRVKRLMATATGMAPGDSTEPSFRGFSRDKS